MNWDKCLLQFKPHNYSDWCSHRSIHTGQERTAVSRNESVALGHHADMHSSMLQGLCECSGTSCQTYTQPTLSMTELSLNVHCLSFITLWSERKQSYFWTHCKFTRPITPSANNCQINCLCYCDLLSIQQRVHHKPHLMTIRLNYYVLQNETRHTSLLIRRYLHMQHIKSQWSDNE